MAGGGKESFPARGNHFPVDGRKPKPAYCSSKSCFGAPIHPSSSLDFTRWEWGRHH